ncbi:hypothetical protein HDU98_005549 [Podochytrium sp. JEL0797]|nr:hypothetical protein HDU98_005549 [Podochytrium sp. JEL0797]
MSKESAIPFHESIPSSTLTLAVRVLNAVFAVSLLIIAILYFVSNTFVVLGMYYLLLMTVLLYLDYFAQSNNLVVKQAAFLGSVLGRGILQFLIGILAVVPYGDDTRAQFIVMGVVILLMAHFGLDFGDWQFLLSTLYVVYSLPNTILPFFSGSVSRAIGSKRFLLITSLALLLGQIVFHAGVIGKRPWVLIAGRVLFGIGGEAAGVAQAAYLAENLESRKLSVAMGLKITASDVPDLDYFHVLQVAEAVQADATGQGAKEAMEAIKYRLAADEPVSVYYTLALLDALYKNCGRAFQAQVIASRGFLQYEFIHRQSLVIENRGQIMELIAEWGTADAAPKEIKAWFEEMWKSGYRFPRSSLSKLTPADMKRIRATSNGQGLSPRINLTKNYLTYPQDLAIPNAATPGSPQTRVQLKTPKSQVPVASLTKSSQETGTGNASAASALPFTFSTKNHFDPRKMVPDLGGGFKWKSKRRVAEEGFALLSDDEGGDEE